MWFFGSPFFFFFFFSLSPLFVTDFVAPRTMWGVADVAAAASAAIASILFTGALYNKSKISRLKVGPFGPSLPSFAQCRAKQGVCVHGDGGVHCRGLEAGEEV